VAASAAGAPAAVKTCSMNRRSRSGETRVTSAISDLLSWLAPNRSGTGRRAAQPGAPALAVAL